MEDPKGNEEVREAVGGAAKLPRLFGEVPPGGEAIESREGGDDLGVAEVAPERAGLEEEADRPLDAEVPCEREPAPPEESLAEPATDSPRRLLSGRGRAHSHDRLRRRVRVEDAAGRRNLNGAQRLLILDSWLRSKLPAHDFAAIAGVSPHTLYGWRKRFEQDGPAGLSDPQGRRGGGSRLCEPTRRAILMLKESHPDWGEDRIHDVLMRGEGFGASPGAIGRVLAEGGWVVQDQPCLFTGFESVDAGVGRVLDSARNLGRTGRTVPMS